MKKYVFLPTPSTLRSFLINISLLLLISNACLCQEATEKDSVTLKDFIPTGVRLGTDVLALIKSGYEDRFSGWEVNADVDFHRYFLAIDFGNWQRSIPYDQGHYSNDGTYYRIGADMNFLTKDPYKNVLFFGVRYARSSFSEEFQAFITDPVWGDADATYTNQDVTARWFELTGGLKVKIWKFLWLGYTARFKFALATSDTPGMLPHDIPGYGTYDIDKVATWGFNYQVLIRLPLRGKDGDAD